MTFAEFCTDLNVTEGEARELIYFLAAMRMRETLQLLNKASPQ